MIVGAARTGTTLLRLLLDAHPEIGCPAEAALPALLSHLAASWLAVHADQLAGAQARVDDTAGTSGTPGMPPTNAPVGTNDPPAIGDRPFSQLSEKARSWLIDTVSAPMAEYCSAHDKRLYCDKSIDSVYHLPLVRELFPAVRSVLVFRHVMDTIASGLEASPWGLTNYGYRPFLESSSGNTVAALAQYWLSHVQRALAWEAEHRDECLRVRYEDLVSAPEDTIGSVFDFLGVRSDPSVLTRAFDRPQRAGPGDHKIAHTSGVHSTSVGHGKRIPVGQIPRPLLREINKALVRLGYEAVTSEWNSLQRRIEPPGADTWGERLTAIMRTASLRPAEPSSPGRVALVADDRPGLRWVIDPRDGSVQETDDDADRVVIGSAEELLLLVLGTENPGVLLRAGRVRHLVTGRSGIRAPQLHQELDWLVAGLRESAHAASPGPDGQEPVVVARSVRPADTWV